MACFMFTVTANAASIPSEQEQSTNGNNDITMIIVNRGDGLETQ